MEAGSRFRLVDAVTAAVRTLSLKLGRWRGNLLGGLLWILPVLHSWALRECFGEDF